MNRFIKINLLPYREIAEQERKKFFHALLIISVIIGTIISLFIFVILKIISFNEGFKLNYLNNEMANLDIKVKKYREISKENEKLIRQRDKLLQLQINRYELLRMLDSINQLLPEKGIYLTDIKYLDALNYKISGNSRNENLISSFMKSLPSTGFFKSVVLNQVKSNNNIINFELTATIVNYNKDVIDKGLQKSKKFKTSEKPKN